MKPLRHLFPYFRPYRKRFAAGTLCVLATALIGMLGPIVIGRAIDALGAGISARVLLLYGAVVVGIALVRGVFRYAQRMILVTTSRHIEFDLRNDFFAHLEKLSPSFYQERNTGDLMARATNDLHAVRMLCGPAIMYAANTLFASTAALLFMVNIHGGLTVVSLLTLPAVAVITKVFGEKIHVLFERVQDQFSNLTTRVQENISGARVVRAYVQEEAEEGRFAELNREYVERNKALIRWQAAFSPLLQLSVGIGFAAVLLYGGHLMIGDRITVGQFVTFNLFYHELVWPMIAVGWVINLTQRGTASLLRLRQIFDVEPEIRDVEPLVRPERIDGAIRFRDLTFAYEEGSPVLEGVDVEVAAGETVAVVGRTGAGKSTLLSLVPRLQDPPPDSLLVDGVDARRLPLESLRRAIAMVPQETFLFSATLGENVAFGRPEASDEEVRRAASLAGLDADLADFPQGLQTMVGERGITLSGGQKQRVALARALLRDPRILLLDDSLSAVDTHTEERILRNLRTVFPGRTVFLVTHRISAAQMADQILVLDHGRIVERGSHAQLLAAGGLYADLHRRQTLEDELAAV
jgi:ATP-binding cassette subfamily B protein